MKTSTALLTVGLTLIAFVLIFGVIYILQQNKVYVEDHPIAPSNITNNDEVELRTCEDLGCGSDTMYVGSVNSDKYYVCSCHYADRILPANLQCFESDEQAVSMGYEWIEC